ncbi:hypothetical protein F3K24_36545 [Streptomyces sp. LBUM 1485]|nr:hypothetical protein [Streptomyces sp. LBUM 1485]
MGEQFLPYTRLEVEREVGGVCFSRTLDRLRYVPQQATGEKFAQLLRPGARQYPPHGMEGQRHRGETDSQPERGR